MTKHEDSSTPPVHGVLAEFEDVTALTLACRRVRDAGFKRWDAHTPFPVHGLDAAMGIRATRLPWLILCAGLLGGGGGLLMEWWTMAVDYPFVISGKPLFSLPAFIPVSFELTVLLSGFAAFFGSLGINRLPRPFNALQLSRRFRRATADRFFIFIEAKDPLFDGARVQSLMSACAPTHVETIAWDEAGPGTRFPKHTRALVAIAMSLAILPLAMIAKAREVPSEKPRIHIIPDDMDQQYKFKPQSMNALFPDERGMRRPPEGTVAHEHSVTPEDRYHTGRDASGAFVPGLPGEVHLSESVLARGQQKYNVFCTPCHGISGHGDGMVARRAEALQEPLWAPPSNLHDARVRQQSEGELYSTIVHGIRSMPAYGPHVDLDDRWAIVAYVRALQLSQHAPSDAVPGDILPSLP